MILGGLQLTKPIPQLWDNPDSCDLDGRAPIQQKQTWSGGVVVGLDALDGEGQGPADLMEERHRRPCVVLVVGSQHPAAGHLE